MSHIYCIKKLPKWEKEELTLIQVGLRGGVVFKVQVVGICIVVFLSFFHSILTFISHYLLFQFRPPPFIPYSLPQIFFFFNL